MSKIIGIIGTRRRDTNEDLKRVNDAFLKIYEEGDKICSGLCPQGGDRFAVILSKLYNVTPIWYPAEWRKYGKGAGFKRNTYIARDSDVLIACVAPNRKGGTEDTIKKYLAFGKTQLILV